VASQMTISLRRNNIAEDFEKVNARATRPRGSFP
jgi:hypothetical protein